jgi:hypothetical protein
MRRKWDSIIKPVIAFALAAAVIVVTPVINGAARAVDLDTECGLTVIKPQDGELKEQLADINLTVDLYKIADAEKINGSDGYGFKLLEPYEALSLGEISTAQEQVELEQAAAAIAIGSQTPEASGDVGAKITGLEAGLYLAVTRGSELTDAKDYLTYVNKVSGDNETIETSIATVAYSDSAIFTFEPQLVSLPTKGADGESGIINSENTVKTSDMGKWNYEITTVLKAGVQPRYGSLKIVKSLLSYEKLENGQTEPATFVFDVEAVMLSGNDAGTPVNVYSNVVSVTFTNAGEQSLLLDDIPIGSTVTVTEVYSGANYVQVSADPDPVVIKADDIASVSFTNDYDGNRHGGGSITNHFEYEAGNDASSENKEGTWNWTQLEDNSSTNRAAE